MLLEDMQQSVYKLIASVDALKENVSTQILGVYDKISILDEKIDNKLTLLEKKMQESDSEMKEMCTKVEQYDDDIRDIKQELEGLKQVKDELNLLKQQVAKIEIKPIKEKASFIDRGTRIIEGVVFTSLAGGIVAFVIYLIKGWFVSVGP